MSDRLKTQLTVNHSPVSLTEFANKYITSVVIGAVSNLKGGSDINTLDFKFEDNETVLIINEAVIPLIPFIKTALTRVIIGLVSSLKGMDRIDMIHLNLTKVDAD